MRQFTTPDQTAQLIELGFEKPKSIASVEPIYGMGGISVAKAYTIGELIEMLPEVLAPSNDADLEMPLSISTDSFMWTVEYDGGCFSPYEAASNELIDALYDMIVKLKEEGVI